MGKVRKERGRKGTLREATATSESRLFGKFFGYKGGAIASPSLRGGQSFTNE